MNKATTFAVSLVAAWLVAGPVQAWRATNGAEVVQVSKGVFEVVARGRSGAQEFWCGAGDYARVALGVAPTQRIYIWRPYGPSTVVKGGRAVQFSFSPPAGADTSTGYSLSVKRAGDNMNAAAAQQYCWGRRLSDF